MNKNKVLIYLIGIVIVLLVVFLVLPYKEYVSCSDYKCNVTSYYSLYKESNIVDISEGLEVRSLSHGRGNLSTFYIKPLGIEYHSRANAKRDKKFLESGDGHITKYSVGELVYTLLTICGLLLIIHTKKFRRPD